MSIHMMRCRLLYCLQLAQQANLAPYLQQSRPAEVAAMAFTLSPALLVLLSALAVVSVQTIPGTIDFSIQGNLLPGAPACD